MTQISVETMFEEWLEVYIKPCRRENTYLCYKNVITMINKFRPELPKRLIGDVREYDLQKLLNDAAKKYSKSTLKKMQIVFSAAYKKAIHNRICDYNPACCLTIPDAAVKKVRALTRDEEAAVREAAKGDSLGHIAIFFLDTGIRTCELANLEWDAYNSSKHEIYIVRSKSKNGVRTVPLIHEAEGIIQKQPHRGKYIFTSTKGTPVTKTVLSKLYGRLRKKTGIQIITNHVYRHSFATRMVEHGADYKALSEILGHSNVNFTINTYTNAETSFLHEQISVIENKPKRKTYKVKELCRNVHRPSK